MNTLLDTHDKQVLKAILDTDGWTLDERRVITQAARLIEEFFERYELHYKHTVKAVERQRPP